MSNAPADYLQQKDTRCFTVDRQEFGSIQRTNVLGCKLSPFVQMTMDDGTVRGYAGEYAREKTVDPKATGKGVPVTLPLDVKGVGFQYLSGMGVSAEQQVALFRAWRALAPAVQASYTSQWDNLDKDDAGALAGWINNLVQFLSSQQ